MAENNKPLRNVQIKIRRSKPITKIVVIVAIVLFTVALLTLRWVQTDIEQNTQEMKEEAGQLLEENADLELIIDIADSVQGVMDYAESELDYVDPDTTFYEPQASEDN